MNLPRPLLGSALVIFVLSLVACTGPSSNPTSESLAFTRAPARSASPADELTICSFNIKFVGLFTRKDNTALSNLVKDYDLVVVQELIAPPVATPEDSTRRRAKQFFDAMASHGFSYVLSESDTGNAALGSNTSATEWFVTFYKPTRVSPVTDLPHGFIAAPLSRNPSFRRVPYAAAFRTADRKLDFVLVSVHLEPDDRAFRAGELRAIGTWIQRQHSTQAERDLIVLGDCNLQSKAELTANTPANFISLNADCVRTNVARGSAKPFDHVFYQPQFTTEMDAGFGFKVVDLVEAMQPGQPLASTAEQNLFFQKYSDHHPVVFRLRIPVRDDD
jgi:endonuclease/exonuclease/phosphatase family metal-dependent hydrolase